MTKQASFATLLDKDAQAREERISLKHELRKLLDESLPWGFQKELVEGLAQVYRDVYEESRAAYPPGLDRDAMGQNRRLKVDMLLLTTAQRWGIKATVAPNASDNSSHVRVKAGPLILTASFVSTHNTMVRSAEFRKTYARDTTQIMFEGVYPDEEGPDPDSSVYAILLHGSNRKAKTEEEQALPAFARIAFPDHTCTKYLTGVDLLRRFWNTGEDANSLAGALGISLKTGKAGKKLDN